MTFEITVTLSVNSSRMQEAIAIVEDRLTLGRTDPLKPSTDLAGVKLSAMAGKVVPSRQAPATATTGGAA